MIRRQGTDFGSRSHCGCGSTGSRQTKCKGNCHQERTATGSTWKLMKSRRKSATWRVCNNYVGAHLWKNWNIFKGSNDSLKYWGMRFWYFHQDCNLNHELSYRRTKSLIVRTRVWIPWKVRARWWIDDSQWVLSRDVSDLSDEIKKVHDTKDPPQFFPPTYLPMRNRMISIWGNHPFIFL